MSRSTYLFIFGFAIGVLSTVCVAIPGCGFVQVRHELTLGQKANLIQSSSSDIFFLTVKSAVRDVETQHTIATNVKTVFTELQSVLQVGMPGTDFSQEVLMQKLNNPFVASLVSVVVNSFNTFFVLPSPGDVLDQNTVVLLTAMNNGLVRGAERVLESLQVPEVNPTN